MAAAVIAGTVVIGTLLVYMPEQPKQPPAHAATQPAPQPSSASPPYFAIGQIAVIRGSKQYVFVAVASQDLDRMTQLQLASDNEGVARMVLARRAMMIESGTRCRVIGRGFLNYEVRILDGACEGRAATIPDEVLTP